MIAVDNVIAKYQQNIDVFTAKTQAFQRKGNYLALLRFVFFVGIAITIYYAYQNLATQAFWLLLPGIIGFNALAKWHERTKQQKIYYSNLVTVNQQEIQTLQHKFDHQPTGDKFYEEQHPYLDDADIFGAASVYQYLCRANTHIGQKTLANWLKYSSTTQAINQRQAAVTELSQLVVWRQHMQAIGFNLSDLENDSDMEQLTNWIKSRNLLIDKKWLPILCIVLSIVCIASTLGWFMGLVHYAFPILFIFINLQLARYYQQAINTIIGQTAQKVPLLRTYLALIQAIEDKKFQNPLLLNLQAAYKGDDKKNASDRIKKLNSLSVSLDIRHNPLAYFLLNTFGLWELQYCLAIERWKTEQQGGFSDWLFNLGEFEALNSLANLQFNQPNWVVPTIHDSYFALQASELGHLLLHPDKRVCNNINIDGAGKLILITGSNMAGKSTFLRTIAVNMILALAGAVVCAKQFSCSNVCVYTSMRTKDSLQENESSFYAELKRLKQIIEAVEDPNVPVFFLLDEILKGTNSQDRHAGSIALVHQMLTNNTSGIIATHDLALCKLANEFEGAIENHCFEVNIHETGMHFDYTFKPGVCKSMNASLLMQQMGIKMP